MENEVQPIEHSYRTEMALTGHKVPVVNEIHLHSIYDPIQEAVELAEKYRVALEGQKNILILGLGFGHHVKEVLNILKNHHGEECRIVVIEPFYKMVKECEIHNPFFETKQITIIHETNIEKLYSTSHFVEFLLTKPGIVYHQASFNAHSHFFKSLITFRSSQDLNEISRFVIKEDLKNYLMNTKQKTYAETIEYIKKDKKKLDDPHDFFLLSLDAL